MKACFDWAPLRPGNGDPTTCPSAAADRGALTMVILGLAMVVLLPFAPLLAFVPLAASILLFGLPHGAVDHLVALGLWRRRLRPAPVFAVLLAYLGVMAAVLFVWWFVPVFALVGFLLLTALHWGLGDLYFDRFQRGSTGLARYPRFRALHVVWRGAVPMLIPFAAHPKAVEAFAEAAVARFAETGEATFTVEPIGPTILLMFVGLAHSGFCLWVWKTRSDRTALRFLAESLLLAGFFILIPPLPAIGLYFCAWHGLRHVLRLCQYDVPVEIGGTRSSARLARFARQATPFTLVSLLLLAVLVVLLPDPGSDPLALTAGYLILISALTAPHLLVVAWMDRAEGGSHCARSQPEPAMAAPSE